MTQQTQADVFLNRLNRAGIPVKKGTKKSRDHEYSGILSHENKILRVDI